MTQEPCQRKWRTFERLAEGPVIVCLIKLGVNRRSPIGYQGENSGDDQQAFPQQQKSPARASLEPWTEQCFEFGSNTLHRNHKSRTAVEEQSVCHATFRRYGARVEAIMTRARAAGRDIQSGNLSRERVGCM